MRRRVILWSGLGFSVFLVGFGVWLLSLPAAPAAKGAPPIPAGEEDDILRALKPPKR
jgi:hypothetical protein